MRGIFKEPEAEPASAIDETGARRDDRAAALVEALAGRSLVLVGMMGSVKTTVGRRLARPLLQTPDPVATMRRLLAEREPIYAQADVTVCSREASHENVVEDVLSALEAHVAGGSAATKMKGGERVEIGVALPGRRYDIVIGENLLGEVGTHIAGLAPGASCAIITDTNVARHHLPPLPASLALTNIRHATIALPPRESSN